jgi:DNA-directed RNA polymerase subunit RPC12/RpoP
MNIYEKIQKIKLELMECNLKKSGLNKFAGFKYYELGDFLPEIVKLCDKYKVYTNICFHENQTVSLSAYDCEDMEAKAVAVTAPTAPLEIRGANALQALGGVQTYMRRYLYMAMFDICESDMFDAFTPKEQQRPQQTQKNTKNFDYKCVDCGKNFQAFTDTKANKWCGADIAFELSKKYSSDGKARCKECRAKTKKTEEQPNLNGKEEKTC